MRFLSWLFRWRRGAPAATLSADERRLARGRRSLADLIAPDVIKVTPNMVQVGNSYTRTLMVTGLPREVDAGWLRPLLAWEEPVEISMHIHPLPSSRMVGMLHHKLVQYDSSRLLAARGGRLADPERETAYADTERLRDAVQRGTEHLFAVSLYLQVWGRSPDELDERVMRLSGVLAGMLAGWRVPLFEQDLGLHACLPEGLDRLQRSLILETTSLALAVPFPAPALRMEQGVLYGVARFDQAPVIIDPFDPRLENANMVIFARSGAGKSYFTKLMALRNLFQGVEFVIIDPEDEYRALCTAVGDQGQRIRLSATSGQYLNPFDLPPAGDETPDPLQEQHAQLLTLLSLMLAEQPGQPLGGTERGVLDRAIAATYARAGITADPTTHARPAPLLRDLYAVLAALPGDTAASLALRLAPFATGALSGLFAGQTNVVLDTSFVVFSIGTLEPELRAVGIHLITGFLWSLVRRSRKPRMLVIDEAWSVLQYPAGAAFLDAMARRARKYYLGLVVISQDIADMLAAPQGRAVLTNASMKLLLKQDPSTVETLVELLQLSSEERAFLLSADKGEGLFFVLGSHVVLQVVASPDEHAIVTTAPRELAERAAATGRSPQPAGSPATDSTAAGAGQPRVRRRLAPATEVPDAAGPAGT